MSRRILVTGGGGFLGRHLCRLLRERGDDPVALDLRHPQDVPWTTIRGSVIDAEAWQTAGRCDALIHAAAITDLWSRDPSVYDRVNRGGTEMAALFARRQGIRLIVVSSYTVLIGRGMRREMVLDGKRIPPPIDLVGAYPRSKRAAEQAALRHHPETVIVRPTAPIGPGDVALTPPMRLLRDVAAGSLPGMMRGRINIVDIRDVAAGTLAALDRGKPGAAYLLSGRDLSLRSFASEVAAKAPVGAPRLEVPGFVAALAARVEEAASRWSGRPVRAPLDGVVLASRPVAFDPWLARQDLGFESRPLDQSIGDAIAFLRQEGLLAG